jgi:hypothetical protein
MQVTFAHRRISHGLLDCSRFVKVLKRSINKDLTNEQDIIYLHIHVKELHFKM